MEENPLKKKKKIFEIKKVINQKKWSKEEDKKLIKLVEENKGKNWKEIALKFHNKTYHQCFSRYKRIRPGINKGSWKKEEDTLILNLIKEYGKSWSKISNIIKTRNGKQIRDRYINVLSPNINKNKFSSDEDFLIIKLYEKYGAKWAKINSYFNNRTTDMIKNRFYSSLKKKYYNNCSINNICFNNKDSLNKNYPLNSTEGSSLSYNNNNINNVNGNINNVNFKDNSTNVKLSYQPSFNKNEKDERKNLDLQTNSLFNNNNELFDVYFDEDDY